MPFPLPYIPLIDKPEELLLANNVIKFIVDHLLSLAFCYSRDV